MEDSAELGQMRSELMRRAEDMIQKAIEYRNSFDNYAYLWVDDRNEFMRQFLLYNHTLTADELDALSEGNLPESPPTLNQFKEQVGRVYTTTVTLVAVHDLQLCSRGGLVSKNISLSSALWHAVPFICMVQ